MNWDNQQADFPCPPPKISSLPCPFWNTCSASKLHVKHIHLKAATAAAAAKLLHLCLTLCDPIDGSPPGSSIPGILQARTLEWVAISLSNAWKWKVKVKSLSRVRLLATPWTVCSPPGSSVHGIFQARVLEWGAIALSIIWRHEISTPLFTHCGRSQVITMNTDTRKNSAGCRTELYRKQGWDMGAWWWQDGVME